MLGRPPQKSLELDFGRGVRVSRRLYHCAYGIFVSGNARLALLVKFFQLLDDAAVWDTLTLPVVSRRGLLRRV